MVNRRLFGVPDEIPDMTRVSGMVRRRRLIYRMKGFGVRKCSGEHREIGGVPERVSGVPEVFLGLMGHKGGHHSPQGAVRPPWALSLCAKGGGPL